MGWHYKWSREFNKISTKMLVKLFIRFILFLSILEIAMVIFSRSLVHWLSFRKFNIDATYFTITNSGIMESAQAIGPWNFQMIYSDFGGISIKIIDMNQRHNCHFNSSSKPAKGLSKGNTFEVAMNGDEESDVVARSFALLKWWIINWNMSFLERAQRTSHLLYCVWVRALRVCFNTVFVL